MVSILIVDDSKTARMMLSHWLKSLRPDCTVIEAENVDSALEKSAGLPADTMAIIDYNMPGKSGIDLAASLQDKIRPQKMALCTANIQDAVIKKAENLGMHYVPKPLTPVKVKALLEKMDSD